MDSVEEIICIIDPDMIQCDNCKNYYHINNILKNVKNYICRSCNKLVSVNFVLAGNYREFNYYINHVHVHQKPLEKIEYISNSNSIRGYNGIHIIRYGTWYQRNDIGKIMDIINSMSHTIE